MAIAETVTAICLRSIEYTERSRIATYLSKELGKLDVLLSQAKGAKAKHGGASELGGIFNLHIRPSKAGSSLCRLEQYEVHTSLHFAKALNYEAYEALMPCLELIRLFAIAFDEDASKRQES
jgi:recombinational DNA repair protein (RecF pathway)